MSPVISCCQADEEGNLHYNPNTVLPIVIHEFCHTYCNPLIAENWSGMKKNATKVFALEKEKLSMQAYEKPEIMMDETFVRASVIRYLLTHGMEAQKSQLIEMEERNGFLLTQDFVEVLGRFEQQRNDYATMQDFMPEIVKTVNAFNTKAYAAARKEAARHNATYTCNIADGATDIPSGEFNLVITFSKPIEPSIALGYGRGDGKFLSTARDKDSFQWDDSQTVLTVSLNLEPNTKYSFSILGEYFRTTDGYTARQTMDISFTTK